MINIINAALPISAQTEKTKKTVINRQSTHGAGHIPICTHGPNLHVPKHIGRPMSGLFYNGPLKNFGKKMVRKKTWGERIWVENILSQTNLL